MFISEPSFSSNATAIIFLSSDKDDTSYSDTVGTNESVFVYGMNIRSDVIK